MLELLRTDSHVGIGVESRPPPFSKILTAHMCRKPTMTEFLHIFRVSSENRPETVISANLPLSSPYLARANPDSAEGRPGRSSC
eukprot:scaffold13087_cov32-Cyclotella_meneghiniana.AAC.2